ncbi:hypothetical protein AVEN_53632-1 [Araneus ventricosus]|uniref:Peptidase aspartic putative domain-containing protein n=1 Tax=Araneus ventricosus TaxID=182803 RepID=A0A4Y2RMI6_ARAVE|nr:hypothetical protein AVEN_53632-1 [Araneus ventricosus]
MDKQSKPLTAKDLNRMRERLKLKLTNIKKFIDSCENTITDKTQIVITAQQKLNGVKVLEEELETLFKQYLDIEEDEKSSNKCDEEMLELLEERHEIEMHNAPCKSTLLCQECHKSDHNSLIHLDSKNQSSITPSNITQSNANFVPLESNTSHKVNSERYAYSKTQSMTNVGATLTSNTKVSSNILCTVQLLIENEYGQKIKIKAILDSGSCVNILTAEVANSLGLKKGKN